MKLVSSLAFTALLLCWSHVQARDYDVSLSGPAFTVSGRISLTNTGTYSAPTFAAIVQDFAIDAYVNGILVQSFSPANSAWGGSLDPFSFGADVNLSVTAERIMVSSRNFLPSSGPWDVFLHTREQVGAWLPNLRLFQNELILLYVVEDGTQRTVRQAVSPPFLLATQVPEPIASAMFLVGLVGVVAARQVKAKRLAKRSDA
jgi:hypothetical protein